MAVQSLHRAPSLVERLRATPWRTLLELAARGGYAARGFVYVSIGGIALLAALKRTPEAEGAVGALEAWGQWPAGIALLWLTGLGLYAFAGWRALQSLFDADLQGRSLKAIAARVGQGISGIIYAALAVSVFGLLDAVEDLSETDDQAATSERIGKILAAPYGEWLVIGVGLFILGCGVGNIARGLFERMDRNLDCDAESRRWLGRVGKVGYVARGIAFLPAGLFTISAGMHARSAEAKGMGEALETLGSQPFGDLVLACISLGLIAFGLFAFVEARYRRIRPADALKNG